MVQTVLENPLTVFMDYGSEHILTASPRILRRDLRAIRQMLVDWEIELQPQLDRMVTAAFETLEETLSLTMKQIDSKERTAAKRQLDTWRESYKRMYGDTDDAANSTSLATIVRLDSESLGLTPMIYGSLFLSGVEPHNAQTGLGDLDSEVKQRLELYVQTMSTYSRVPDEASYRGIRKAGFEGHLFARLYGVNFTTTFKSQLLEIVHDFAQGCLTEEFGGDNSAAAIADSGINIKDRESRFTGQIDLAAKLVEDFGGKLHYDFAEQFSQAIQIYADGCHRDFGTQIQQALRESDPKLVRRKMIEAYEFDQSAKRVGEKYNTPIPQAQINVTQFG